MRSNRSIQLFLTVTLLFTLALVIAAPVLAQDAATSDVTPDDVNAVARQLWCPLCSGVRLDACELKACDQMKDEIAIKLGEGEDVDAIKQYFVNQYGPQVLGEPPREGFNLLAWVLPVLVLLGGGVFLVTVGRRMLRRDEPAAAVPPPGDGSMAAKDPYDQRLDEELKAYD
ncbi:MAG: cytochrome c-type biogenesis protein CcmH [Caldilineaceae bacterium]|nr:cytochrome c-type biogenesis protein CcmH [Caldilineaceae bacterium]